MDEPARVLRRVKRLELQTRHVVDTLVHGAYSSMFRGRGIEFSEVREYRYGDDVRSIDWNVTARMNRPYVKEFVEERDVTLYLLLDVSASSEFTSRQDLKREIATEILASIALSAARLNDRVSLVLFSREVERYIPPKKGRRHALRLIREMVAHTPEHPTTDLAAPLDLLSRIARRRSVVVLVSDFMVPLKPLEQPLRLLRRRHDMIAVEIYDPRETEMPDVGPVAVEDAETGEQIVVDTSSRALRERYRALALLRQETLSGLLKRARVDRVAVSTAAAWDRQLVAFLRRRARGPRRRWG